MPNSMTQDFKVHACLPFVALAEEKSISLGPVTFWPAVHFKNFIDLEGQDAFFSYIQSIGQIKAAVTKERTTFVNTIKVNPDEVTCISIHSAVIPSKIEPLLIDSLYLLYFASTFHNLYFGNEIPSFNAFRKMIPAGISFLKSPKNWENLFIKENYREDTICLHLLDPEICKGFSQLLSNIYIPSEAPTPHDIESYERIIRSLRYLIDRFYPRFVNLVEKGLSFSKDLYEPEDVIFIGASFEALLDIHEENMAADFKHKLRPMLHFKYAKPVELFWKWVDDFYEVRKKIIRGGSDTDANFRLNPNFIIPHTLIGIKLFIYAVNHTLYDYQLVPNRTLESDLKATPEDEILLFFWTEESLIRKIERYLEQLKEEGADKTTLTEDITSLSHLFVMMQEKRYLQQGVTFIPTPLEQIEKQGHHILKLIKENNSLTLPSNFGLLLEERLKGQLEQPMN